MPIHYFFLIFALGIFGHAGFSQEPSNYHRIDPAEYMRTKSITTDQDAQNKTQVSMLKEDETTIKGVKYRVFKSQFGSIIIPKLQKIDRQALEGALCATSPGKDEAVLMQSQVQLSSEVQAYAALIQETIKKSCGQGNEYIQDTSFGPELEVGVKWRDKSHPTKSYKIYNQGLTPSLGFGMEW